MLSNKPKPDEMQQKGQRYLGLPNEELDGGEGIITDRHRESSDNEKVMTGHVAAAMSARNQCQSRQEDLETVYMQSTIQFSKDLHAHKLGCLSKSPDPQLEKKDPFTTNPYISEKSQMSVEEKPTEENIAFSNDA